MRRSLRASTRGQLRGQIKEAVSIRERLPEVEDRAMPGHWERDLLVSSRHTPIATLVGRSSRFIMLVRVGEGHRERGRRARRAGKTAAWNHDGYPHLRQGSRDGRP